MAVVQTSTAPFSYEIRSLRLTSDAVAPADALAAFVEFRRLSDFVLAKELRHLAQEFTGYEAMDGGWRRSEQTYYTYRLTSSDSKRYYLGVRGLKLRNASIADCLDDPYLGSGGKKFQDWLSCHSGRILKEIVEVFSFRRDAYEAEAALVGELWRTDRLCLNAVPGGARASGLGSLRGASSPLGFCAVHGAVKLRGEVCDRCLRADVMAQGFCELHGETRHMGKLCMVCHRRSSQSTRTCKIHGASEHHGSTCVACVNGNAVTVKGCSIHGQVKHRGMACITCTNRNSLTTKICTLHGEAIHFDNVCAFCNAQESTTVKHCKTHGSVTHRGKACQSCVAQASIAQKECPKHGLSKHRGESCFSCAQEKAMIQMICSVHGETRHRGETCLRCSSLKRVHSRYHKLEPKTDCPHCEV